MIIKLNVNEVKKILQNCTSTFTNNFNCGKRTPEQRDIDVKGGSLFEIYVQYGLIDNGYVIYDRNENILSKQDVFNKYFERNTYDDGIDFYMAFPNSSRIYAVQMKSRKNIHKQYKIDNVDKNLRCLYGSKETSYEKLRPDIFLFAKITEINQRKYIHVKYRMTDDLVNLKIVKPSRFNHNQYICYDNQLINL